MKINGILVLLLGFAAMILSCSKNEYEPQEAKEKMQANQTWDIAQLRADGKIISETPDFLIPNTNISGTRYVVKVDNNERQEIIVTENDPNDINYIGWFRRGKFEHLYLGGQDWHQCTPHPDVNCWAFGNWIIFHNLPQQN